MLLWMSMVGSASAQDAPQPVPTETEKPAEGRRGRLMKQKATCPNDVITATGWPGEYPRPVVHVKNAVQVSARTTPCEVDAAVSCTLEAGLYHPWVKSEGTAYVTVRTVGYYEATRNMRLGDERIRRGDKIQLTQDLGEGFCTYSVSGNIVEAECPGRMTKTLSAVPGSEPTSTQMVRVECGGERGWVAIDDALMTNPSITEGVLLEYGKVGPAPAVEGPEHQ